jgi:hypothetical protein
MRKLAFVLAATVAISAPAIASAQSFDGRIGGDRDMHRDYRDTSEFRGARAEYYGHDRGLHRGWYKDRGERTVIIKKQRRNWDD